MRGNCLDNSVMENFFGRLKVEMFYGETFASTDEFISRCKEYITYYNVTAQTRGAFSKGQKSEIIPLE